MPDLMHGFSSCGVPAELKQLEFTSFCEQMPVFTLWSSKMLDLTWIIVTDFSTVIWCHPFEHILHLSVGALPPPHFIHKMMKSFRPCWAYIHSRPLSYRFQAFKNLDLLSTISRLYFWIFTHSDKRMQARLYLIRALAETFPQISI